MIKDASLSSCKETNWLGEKMLNQHNNLLNF